MELLKEFKEYIRKENLFQPADRLLIAVSGGVDSSVLCALCAACGYDFSIAHCNFQLRGEESGRDEAFVKNLSNVYKVPYFIKVFDTRAEAKRLKKGIEETARILRYEWFASLMNNDLSQEQKGYKYLLTAHHADDNIETVLMNFFRSTGIKGLRGIMPKVGNIVRPLLFAGRKDIELYAEQNNISFVQDSTNTENNYTRNYFRNELIPSIEKVFPGASGNISGNIKRFAEIEYLYEERIGVLKSNLIEKKGAEIHLPVLKLEKTKPLQTILYEIIKEYGFTPGQVTEAQKLLSSDSGKYIVSATHRILRNRKWLIISPLSDSNSVAHFIIEKDTKAITFDEGELTIMHGLDPSQISTDADSCFFDEEKITYPLLLRKWKQGDYFYPLGMQNLPAGRHGKKKLSRFFADLKLSLLEKEKVWIVESDKKIIWIAGYRMDDRFKITAKTANIVRLHLVHASRTN